jgi:hypothetical protein
VEKAMAQVYAPIPRRHRQRCLVNSSSFEAKRILHALSHDRIGLPDTIGNAVQARTP